MSGGFDADWLALREGADRRARDPEVRALAADWLAASPERTLVDLGCGTGATYRALQPYLPENATWNCLDHDPALLEEARKRTGSNARMQQTNIAVFDESSLRPGSLVTCSALLDLVGRDWLVRLARCLADRGCAFYAALDVSAPPAVNPDHPADNRLLAAFAHHQSTDKGFGPALGLAASGAAARIFESAGYGVRQGTSDWQLDRADTRLIERLIAGWADAARQIEPALEGTISAWLTARRRQNEAGELRILVPHSDLFAAPPP